MSVLFSPDTVLPHDAAGWGRWLLGHGLEHRQFVTACTLISPPVAMPDYDLYSWSDEPLREVTWRNVHQQAHVALRAVTGVSGIDLSLVDLRDDESFFEWLEDHRQEHSLMRQVFGIS